MLTNPFLLAGTSLLLHGLVMAPFLGVHPSTENSKPAIYISYVKYEAPKKIEAPPAAKPAAPLKRSGRDEKKVRAAKPALTHSADLLVDPKRRAAFSSYYGEIKEKIEKVIRRKGGVSGSGEVHLRFILDQKGVLEGVWVMGGSSGAGADEKRFAAECVNEAGSFEPFPKELRSERISFSLTLRF